MNVQIIRDCSDYLKESEGHPLVRRLPVEGSDFRKIKVRKKKSASRFDGVFNSLFMEHPDLRQRCIFANGLRGLLDSGDDSLDTFYVFPPNGYKYLFSGEVRDSSIQYKEMFDKMIDLIEETQATEMFKEILKYEYQSTGLSEAIQGGSEVIMYGIPYYYALRKSAVKSYSTLFSL